MSFSFSNLTPSNDHSHRLIQTAYTCLQQLSKCNGVNDEQRQRIQTWMEAVTNVRIIQKDKEIHIQQIYIFIFEENSEDFYNDIHTYQVTNLQNALQTVFFRNIEVKDKKIK